ncbi:MAG TPA: Asp23/Gls24 family envelope stress response protein [Ktedonobacterales bacterium]|jgi:uncharacterized alkaline shock family protein YloU
MSETRLNSPNYRPIDRVTPFGIASGSSPGPIIEASTPQGKTTVEDIVVAKIVDIAAREIDGVHDLTPTSSVARAAPGGMTSGLASRITSGEQRGQKVNVLVGEREAAVDMGMIVNYGVSIPQVADAVRRNVIARIAAMTGLVVKEVNIDVSDLYFPQESEQSQPQPRVQ